MNINLAGYSNWLKAVYNCITRSRAVDAFAQMEEKDSGATEDRRGPSRADAGGDTHARPGGLVTST